MESDQKRDESHLLKDQQSAAAFTSGLIVTYLMTHGVHEDVARVLFENKYLGNPHAQSELVAGLTLSLPTAIATGLARFYQQEIQRRFF